MAMPAMQGANQHIRSSLGSQILAQGQFDMQTRLHPWATAASTLHNHVWAEYSTLVLSERYVYHQSDISAFFFFEDLFCSVKRFECWAPFLFLSPPILSTSDSHFTLFPKTFLNKTKEKESGPVLCQLWWVFISNVRKMGNEVLLSPLKTNCVLYCTAPSEICLFAVLLGDGWEN